jgi:alpha-1,6-mannosyltransferase
VSLRSCLAAGMATEAAYLSLYLLQAGPASTMGFILVQAVAWVIFGIVVWAAVRASPSTATQAPLWCIVGSGIVFRLTLVPHVPIASDDAFRYVWDGRIALHGINPFSFAPSEPALAKFATDELPALINHPALKSAYPAVAQIFFLISNLVFGPSVTGYKLLLATVDSASILLLVKAVKAFELPLHLVVLYVWSPMAVMYGALEGHIDILGIPFLLLVLLWWHAHHHVRAGVALGVAALVKLHPVLAAPFLTIRSRGWRGWWPAILPVVVLALGLWLYDEPSHGFFNAVATMGEHWEFNSPFFTVAYAVTGDNHTAHLASATALLAWVAWIAVRPGTTIEKVFRGFLGFVILGPTAHPWYFLWIAAIAVFRWSPALLVLLALTNLSNIVVYRFHATGVWLDDPVLIALEYGIPLLLAVILRMRRRRTEGTGGVLRGT